MSIVQEKIVFPADQSFRLLRWNANLRDVDLVLAPGSKQRLVGEGQHWHYHEAFELICFRSGTGTSFIGDRIQPLKAGDVVLLGSNLPHYWHMRGSSGGWVTQWHWGAASHFWAIPETVDLEDLHKEAARGIHYTGRTAGLIAAHLAELETATGIDRLGIFLRCLAAAMAAPAAEKAPATENFRFFAPGSSHQTAMQAVIRHLFENFRRPVALDEILGVAKMSKPTFSRQFKAHAGMSLRAFLQQIRLDAVVHELGSSERTVSEIAMSNGFSELSFFNRLFLRVHGCRPLQLRRRLREKSPQGIRPSPAVPRSPSPSS